MAFVFVLADDEEGDGSFILSSSSSTDSCLRLSSAIDFRLRCAEQRELVEVRSVGRLEVWP